MTQRIICLLILFVFISPVLFGQTEKNDELIEKIDSLKEDIVKFQNDQMVNFQTKKDLEKFESDLKGYINGIIIIASIFSVAIVALVGGGFKWLKSDLNRFEDRCEEKFEKLNDSIKKVEILVSQNK